MAKTVSLDGATLTLEDFISVTRNGASVSLDDEARKRVEESRRVVDSLVSEGRPMYGINTGFGRFADVAIPEHELNLLQVNLILSDACGVGDPLPRNIARGMLLLRANSLAGGFSGVRPGIIETLIDMLNKGVHPIIPEKGSVGSSGDLCPLSHMVLPMLGLGEAEFRGTVMPGGEAMSMAGIPTIQLRAKEGLALINGTQCMTSVAAHALYDSAILLKSADIAAALTMESLRGIIDAFDPRIHAIRKHKGQIESASNIRRLLDGSGYTTHQGEERMQDAYSVRCSPQVHGAVKTALEYAKGAISTEMNAVTDNPLVFTDSGDVFSGGNFHGEPIAIASDTLGIAMAEVGSVSERRIAKLIDPATNHGLPAFLVKNGGINCGFMIPQYVAAALVSENKVLAHPASVDSIPTSAGQEDHVSMGTIAARKASTIVSHVAAVLGIELMCAAQAIDLQGNRAHGKGTSAAYKAIRERVAAMENDRIFYKDQNAASDLVGSGALLKAVEAEVGALE
ncbi:MAG: histidine ammonia-lyase [Synergistaceae bacterium]|jgi:histidine ammonia-lyase|nr:histidine ammonia-lyase [Synergistaceae bacterium]